MTPIRPNGRDLSLKITNDTYALRWFPMSGVPHTASQTEKDMMEWTLFAHVFDVIREIGAYCPNATKFAYGPSGINTVTTRLGCGSQYEGALQKPAGAVWTVPPNGRHYSIERTMLRKFRDEILAIKLAASKEPIRAKLAAQENLRDLLDLNPECSGPATFTLGTPPPKVDGVREDAFPVDTRELVTPPLTSRQRELLDAAHKAHHDVSAWRKDPANVPEPPKGIVETTQLQFEASAADERQLHFFAMKAFRGFEHPTWTRAQLGTWAAIQDVYHHRWKDKIESGDWKARGDDTDHLFAHLAMNDADQRLLYLFSCGNAQRIDTCGKLTSKQALEELPARLGLA